MVDIYISDKRKLKIQDSLIKWTPQAIDCFERNCNCHGCEINDVLETQCVMKYIVKKIYEKDGNPPEKTELEQVN